MHLPSLRIPVLSLLAIALCAGETPTTPTVTQQTPPEELQEIGSKKLKVMARQEMRLKEREDDAVKARILWYRAFDGKAFGSWQKHGIQFDTKTPILWSIGEGHWQAHVQIEQTSGAKSPDPSGDIDKAAEFIIDRTAPAVRISFPSANQKLRGNDRYTIRWEATDAHLRSTPIAIRFSRDGSTWETVAENLANSGTYEWTTPGGHAPSAQLRVEAMDKAGNIGHTIATGLVLDSTKPTGAVSAPAITNNRAITFTTEVTDTGPAGVASAKLWFSQDDGTSWTEGPTINAPYKGVEWRAPADGRFRVAIVAVDGAGNMTNAPKGKEGQQFVSVVDTVAPTIALAYNIGINDANLVDPTARRAFKPGDRLQVAYTIRDANLKPNSVSVFMQLDAAKPWVEIGSNLPTDAAFRFELGKDVKAEDTKTARIKVTASDLAGNSAEAIATEVFEIQTAVRVDGPTIE